MRFYPLLLVLLHVRSPKRIGATHGTRRGRVGDRELVPPGNVRRETAELPPPTGEKDPARGNRESQTSFVQNFLMTSDEHRGRVINELSAEEIRDILEQQAS